MQKRKLIVSLLGLIYGTDFELGIYELNPSVVSMLDMIEEGVDRLISERTPITGLSIFEDVDIISPTSIPKLLLYYDHIKKSKSKRDLEVSKKALGVDTVGSYIDRVEKIALQGTKYYCVLKEPVVSTIKHEDIDKYYKHYLDTTSRRFYRTIPDVDGRFVSEGKVFRYRTYDVDDPEQLIAGARMTPDVKTSCFQLGHYQKDTFKYITSSPNGVIVAVEDEEGNFLGRVYGYRVGNTVHFTRIYFNVPFSFKEIMERIARDIIDGSSEIDYVTCIPNLSNETQYINKNIINHPPEDIDYPQEEGVKPLDTDHGGRFLSIVASRYPISNVDEVKFERKEISEKFYKKRKKPRLIDLSKLEEDEEELEKAKNVAIRSGCDASIIATLSEADRIVLGEDWLIIESNGRKVVLRIDYGEKEVAKKYKQHVQVEIDETLKSLEQEKNQEEDTHLDETRSQIPESGNGLGGR